MAENNLDLPEDLKEWIDIGGSINYEELCNYYYNFNPDFYI